MSTPSLRFMDTLVVKLTSELVEHQRKLTTRFTAADPDHGEVVSPPYGYPGGRRFHFRDPSGNVLGVYRSNQAR